MSRKYSISRPMPLHVREAPLHLPLTLILLNLFVFGFPLLPPPSFCSATLVIPIREFVSLRVFPGAKRTQRYPSSEDQHDDQFLSEHYHVGQQLREPPFHPSTMSTGDRGNFPNTPNTVSPLQTAGFRYGAAGGSSPLLTPVDGSSLSVNYLPTKFGSGPVSRKRYGKEVSGVHKQGGGREAFKANESRMPGANDEDYDGVQGTWFGRNPNKPALRWTKFKWVMFVANILVRPFFIYLSVPPLNARFAVDDILPHFPHFLPAYMVPRLGPIGCRPTRKH